MLFSRRFLIRIYANASQACRTALITFKSLEFWLLPHTNSSTKSKKLYAQFAASTFYVLNFIPHCWRIFPAFLRKRNETHSKTVRQSIKRKCALPFNSVFWFSFGFLLVTRCELLFRFTIHFSNFQLHSTKLEPLFVLNWILWNHTIEPTTMAALKCTATQLH